MAFNLGSTEITDINNVRVGADAALAVYLGDVLILGDIQDDVWDNTVWDGSVGFVSQPGVPSINNGNAASVTVLGVFLPGATTALTGVNLQNRTNSSRQVEVNLRVFAPGGFSPASFDMRYTVNQAGIAVPPPPPPTNIYTDWTDDGGLFNQNTSTSNGPYSAFATITTPASQEFLNERRCRDVTTSTTAQQNQTRVCTASGGCTGALSRTINVNLGTSTNRECETRVSSTRNPDFVRPFETSDIIVTCSVGVDGVIRLTAIANPTLASGQQISIPITITNPQSQRFNVLPVGASQEFRDIGWRVSNYTIPAEFSVSNAGSPITATGTCRATQSAPQLQPPNLNIVVRNNTQFFTNVQNGALIEVLNDRDYTVSGGDTLDPAGNNGVFSPLQGAGRSHTVSETNAAGTSSATFRVRGVASTGTPTGGTGGFF